MREAGDALGRLMPLMISGGIALAVVLLAFSGSSAAAARGSLPQIASGHRPGPDALYAPAPKAPQLENARPWRARPILVSGAQAYRDGEWLYQDFLYDDAGAAGVPDLTSPYGPGAFSFSPHAGTFTYPTDPVYASNAADLVELRVRPRPRATRFRVTLNTLKDPSRTAFTIALGSSDQARAWPHGAGVSSPAELFLTAHGSTAELSEAADGKALSPEPRARVSRARRQIEVRVPHAAWNPKRREVRMTIGVGLWDPRAGSYLAPRLGQASESQPGGGGPLGAAIVNVGPRFDEPMPELDEFPIPYTIADAAVGAAVQAAFWRERSQADALRLGGVSEFHAEVDFAKLARRVSDNSRVPKRGPMNRILVSRHSFGQGFDPSRLCGGLGGATGGTECFGTLVGRLQPYSLYVPKGQPPKRGWGMTLLLHSLAANYNQYTDSKNQSELGERGPGSLVATPSARGPDGGYTGIPEADAFEVWADLARRYKLDSRFAAVSGYSMGGFGTYRFLARWPDLFARGMSTVAAPGSAEDQLASLRNTPIMAWNALADELVNIGLAEEAALALTDEGLRFVYDLFLTADHLSLATNDEYGPAADFLGNHRVKRHPPRVTYVVDPSEDSKRAKAVANHAYWLSGLRVRDPEASSTGTIDARSLGFGVGDPAVSDVEPSADTLNGGAHGPMPFARREQAWGPAPKTKKRDRLEIDATNIAAAKVDVRRARVSCDVKLDVTTDGPFRIRLPGCRRTVRFGGPG